MTGGTAALLLEPPEEDERGMATSSDTLSRIIGLALLVGGLGVAFWGYQLSGSLAAQLERSVTGALPDTVMYRYIGGAVCSVVGLFLLAKR
jgi:hypothetical protein